ncbi:DUF58 domain-containing protein [Sandaracinus amylolyticus]|uniref:DUF58 domain-containing protein n=1 Tax=Sandaracinus amylolyticus TaxID=927083 RepID=UPI001F3CD64A|nr:DUF58 domain-containing protein [Sandaracinus amylolyticus]UJR84441.1 Hypothetical protein I5071_65200 [Sandaracinus amylolyticus]
MNARLARFARRARDVFPLTRLGVVVVALVSLALWIGVRQVDLVLLGASAIVGVALALGILTVVIARWRVAIALRRIDAGNALSIECGFPARTGFRLPRLRWLPGARVTWRWIAPHADLRMLEAGAWIDEEVTPRARRWSDSLTRRIEVGDAFGLCAIAMEHVETRPVHILPSVGGLKQMHVVHTLSGGSDITHPAGSPDGERLDLRQYAPGDPIRFVLWSVFARTRELVIRTPEKALSAARRTLAYLVTGPADEPAAGAARVAVDVGALGGDWAFGADGVDAPATTRDAALEALAKSASAPHERAGSGLGAFLRKASKDGAGRAVVFVPGRPGPWLAGVVHAAKELPLDVAGRAPIEFVVCTDGVDRAKPRSGLAKLALQDREEREIAVAQSELQQVVAELGKLRAKIVIVDRRGGHVHPAAGA